MARQSVLRLPWYLLDVLVFVFCCIGIAQIAKKPGLPLAIESRADTLRVAQVNGSNLTHEIRPGDALLSINGSIVSNPEDVEFVLDGHRVGDRVLLQISGSQGTAAIETTLGRYYGVVYLAIVVVVGGLFFGIGLFVLWKKQGDPAARVYHLGSLLTALMLSTTWGSYLSTPAFVGVSLRVIFSAVYAFVPLLFFHFIRLFPRSHPFPWRGILPTLYGIAAVLAIGNGFTFVQAWKQESVPLFHTHLAWFTSTRWFMILLVTSGLWTIRQSYRSAQHESERRKLRWIVWGLFIGFVPFVALWVIPQMLLSYALVPEEVMLLASGFIPLAFGVSIVKYQIMDIDLLFTRSVVYGTATALVIIVYVTIIGVIAAMLSSVTTELPVGISTMAAVLVALLFDPIRRMTQVLVDRRFFRVKYDFRLAERRIKEDFQNCFSAEAMAQLLAQRIDSLIVPERIAVALFSGEGLLSVPVRRDFAGPDNAMLAALRHEVTMSDGAPLGRHDFVEPGVRTAAGQGEQFADGTLAMAYPLPSSTGEILGLLLVGRKRAGTRFSHEDCELLERLAALTGLEIERVQLQRQIIEKAHEAERLQRLNTLKSDFVSYVSHELRTPLTSIKMFAELLLPRLSRKDKSARDYVGIIEGESERLQRMVNTILDSAKIDNGEQQYTMRTVSLDRLVRAVLRGLRYQFTKERFTVRLHVASLPPRKLIVQADPDAARQAVLNLLSNAMKYSREDRRLDVRIARHNMTVRCSVTDRGRGISPEAIGSLFEKFYRDPSLPRQIQGVGLGLSVVKHIMDAHGGTVTVESTPGAGSTFTLVFPAGTVSARTPSRQKRRRV
jgi:signal transduction histidine kinase